MSKWEHTFTETYLCSESDVDIMLNKIGDDGWELVSVVQREPYPKLRYFFKRKVFEYVDFGPK